VTTYLIRFYATVERQVDVPNDLNWTEAYQFVRDQMGWDQVAHSAAARTTIDTTRVRDFIRADKVTKCP
jgi:hypothetical protein